MNSKHFKNDHLSFSRLQRFEQCPKSFELHYIKQLNSEPNESLRFGSLLHKVLERLFHWIIEEEYAGKLDEERLVNLFREEWPSSGLSGFALYEEGLSILKSYLRETPIIDHRDILAVEQEFRLQIGNYELMGFIDRANRIDDETIQILDYKTNRLIFTREEIDTTLQLTVYHLAAQKLWPWAKKIQLTYYLLRHGFQMNTERNEEQLDAAKNYILSLAKQIETAKEYPPKLNTNCQYCDHRSHCPAYQKAIEGHVEIIKSSPDDLEAVAREREHVANLAKILYARKAELEKILKAQLEEQETLELAGMVYRMSHSKQVTYPVEATLNVFQKMVGINEQEAREQLLVVDKAHVDTLIKQLGKSMKRPEHQMLKAELDAVAETTFTPRFYSKEAT